MYIMEVQHVLRTDNGAMQLRAFTQVLELI